MTCKVVLFGCGILGYEALAFIGREHVSFFCDNNPALSGTFVHGVEVLSFDRLKQECGGHVILLCAVEKNAFEIAAQCEENGLYDYLLYEPLRRLFPEREGLLAFMADERNRERLLREQFLLKIKSQKSQIAYFKRHADIRHMKPAMGVFRDRQLKSVQVITDFFEHVKELEITPFLDAGNLLGYVRHGGFIPWDDDMDFGIMREDYEKLKRYCLENLYSREAFYSDREHTGEKAVHESMEKYYWKDLADHIQIVAVLAGDQKVWFDFFVLDFYREDYSCRELLSYAEKMREKYMAASSLKEKINCIEYAVNENRKNTVKESGHIYFGIDNMTIMQKYQKGEWISREVVFPLRKVFYEGAYFWIPNDPERYLEFEYDDMWDFPDDVGIPRHMAEE